MSEGTQIPPERQKIKQIILERPHAALGNYIDSQRLEPSSFTDNMWTEGDLNPNGFKPRALVSCNDYPKKANSMENERSSH
jgi:hypothetical protein